MAYTAANPGYTGNLYICIPHGGSTKEQWLQHLTVIRETSPSQRTQQIYGHDQATGDTNGAYTGFGWVVTGGTFDNGQIWQWTTGGIPTDWGNINYVLPTRAFVINLTNESEPAYHATGTTQSGSGNLSTQPTGTWFSDWNNFVAAHAGMDYFGGILYPLANGSAGTTANMLLHGYASITGQDPIIEADFQAALGPNFANGGYGPFFSGSTSNPYVANTVDMTAYNYSGVFTKQSSPGTGSGMTLDFTAAEFANDINNILQGSDTTSQVNVVESYDPLGILSIRGFTSQTIDFNVNAEGCIEMEIDCVAVNDCLEVGTGEKGDKGLDGNTGSKGEVGPKGDTGSKGEVGAKGEQGNSVTGAKGEQGNSITGDKGATGDQGDKGATGDAGDKGEQGNSVTGDKGATGAKGEQGNSVTGAKGEQGNSVTGAKGDAGDKGEVGVGQKGATGSKGDTGDQGASITGDKGATGDQGDKGTTGSKGDTGDKGATGDAGAKGTTGDAGDKGEQGNSVTGAKGEQGNSITGDKGATGDAGAKGATGDAGDKGEQGNSVTGAKGEQGNSITGDAGAKGATGDAGDKGEQGNSVTGAKGEQGNSITGDKGATGSKGATGDQGDKGEVGIKGATGDQGDKGAKGGPGTKGSQGETGIGFEYEHIALNPIARDEAFSPEAVRKTFVKVPTTLDTSWYLWKIEASYGDASQTGATQFRLKKVNSSGTTNAVTGTAWTHASGTLMHTQTMSDDSINDLGGDYVYIDYISGAEDGTGYSVTLIWKKSIVE